MQNPISWAVVTPSYSGDLEICRLLCRSMDAFLTGNWHHYLVVDKPDLELFRGLAGPRRSILLTNDVVPPGMRHICNVPFFEGRSLWWSPSTGPIIGWHQQQFVKIGMAGKVSEAGLIYCDSDVFFIRPLDVSTLERQGRVRLYQSYRAFTIAELSNPKFTTNALGFLGLPVEPRPYFDYVDNVVTWHRQTVLDMCSYVEKVNGRNWHAVLARRLKLSEYALYGNYVEAILKSDAPVYIDSQSLCRTKWDKSKSTEAGLREFCAGLSDHHVALGIQSFNRVDVGVLESIFEEALAGRALASSSSLHPA